MANLIDRYHLFRLRTRRDPEAFARIYDRYVEAIYRFSILKLPSKEDAQDVTAETFTRAWQYVYEHKEITNIRALLYRIARNLIADKYRQSEPVVSLETVTFTAEGTSYLARGQEPGDGQKGKELIEARADMALIIQKLGTLKEDYRDVLTLRLIDGLSFGVIAEILEKKPGNVRVMYHRALKAIKQNDER
ncbi:sigma-70 family RNA polymerase sigma factor [Candidatus Uhrbacteria bacterium]|nr:sigma-70 family RNA polymerase sigma factor [Candidatus Uhrbacteria bacterium]